MIPSLHGRRTTGPHKAGVSYCCPCSGGINAFYSLEASQQVRLHSLANQSCFAVRRSSSSETHQAFAAEFTKRATCVGVGQCAAQQAFVLHVSTQSLCVISQRTATNIDFSISKALGQSQGRKPATQLLREDHDPHHHQVQEGRLHIHTGRT